MALAGTPAGAGSGRRRQPDSQGDVRLSGGPENHFADFDSDIEVITPEVQKIQFTNSGTLLLHRPNEIRLTRTVGYADVEMFFDGKTAQCMARISTAIRSWMRPARSIN